MSWWWVAGLAILAVAGIGLYLSSTAGRLDRLHRRIDTSRLSLDAHLLRRSSIALEVAASGVLDPASNMLIADAAHAAQERILQSIDTYVNAGIETVGASPVDVSDEQYNEIIDAIFGQ